MNPECLNLGRVQQSRWGKTRWEGGEEVAWEGPERDQLIRWLGREETVREGGVGGGGEEEAAGRGGGGRRRIRRRRRRRETWRIRHHNMKGTQVGGKAGAPRQRELEKQFEDESLPEVREACFLHPCPPIS